MQVFLPVSSCPFLDKCLAELWTQFGSVRKFYQSITLAWPLSPVCQVSRGDHSEISFILRGEETTISLLISVRERVFCFYLCRSHTYTHTCILGSFLASHVTPFSPNWIFRVDKMNCSAQDSSIPKTQVTPDLSQIKIAAAWCMNT